MDEIQAVGFFWGELLAWKRAFLMVKLTGSENIGKFFFLRERERAMG